jgi:hypothetical protein
MPTNSLINNLALQGEVVDLPLCPKIFYERCNDGISERISGNRVQPLPASMLSAAFCGLTLKFILTKMVSNSGIFSVYPVPVP